MSRDRAAWFLGKEQGSHGTGAHATRTDVQGIWGGSVGSRHLARPPCKEGQSRINAGAGDTLRQEKWMRKERAAG